MRGYLGCPLSIALFLLIPLGVSGTDRETFLKRVKDTEGMKAALTEWEPALNSATGETIDKMNLFFLLPQIDSLWDKDYKVQPEASKRYVARLKGIDKKAVEQWQAALYLATGKEDVPASVTVALLIIQQDRLFDREGKRTKVMEAMLGRLVSVPPKAVTEWAELRKQDKAAAALSLINEEQVFQSERFQEPAFRKLCDELKAKKPK